MDCDQFYVQVARLEDPEGAGREEYLLVGGAPSERGVVTSASYPVRRFGVRSGMPTARALRLCPRAVVVPVPRAACVRRSRAVREVLEDFSPVVEAASIDEFYLDLTGTERLFRNRPLVETAREIRETVQARTGISVSIGGATRKLVAKLAAGLAKPGGVHVVPPGEEEAFLRRFRLREIPGIGPSFARGLEERGLLTVEDVLPVEEAWLRKWFGDSRGGWLFRVVRGLDATPVRAREPRKSISAEHTFPADVSATEELEEQLLRLAGSVGSTLRAEGLLARTVSVKLRDADFRTRQAGHTLPDPLASDAAIFAVARELLRELRGRRRAQARLLGVSLSGLVTGSAPVQLELFPDGRGPEGERDRRLARVLDDLRARFGKDAVLPARLLEERRGMAPPSPSPPPSPDRFEE